MTPTTPHRDFRQDVTDAIIQMLEQGVAPWQKPWQPGALQLPFNPTSDHVYRGGNALHLMATAAKRNFADPRWLTYKQAQENGWQVRQGEKGTHIEYWQFPDRADPDAQADHALDTGPTTRAPIHRVYTVFNASQIDGIPAYEPKHHQEWEVVQSGEDILRNSGAAIHHDQNDRAFYSRTADEIHLPLQAAFPSAADYYGTALHELSHWSGAPHRLNRATLTESYTHGDPNYAKEELRAELASVFLAAERGIPHNPEQHAAYVGAWIEALSKDKNEIFRAAKDAHQAADFLIALERERSPEAALKAIRQAAETPRRETSEWAAQYEPGSQTVDITEKDSATERRSATQNAKLHQEQILDNQVDGRNAPPQSDLQRSFDDAHLRAQHHLGAAARTYAAHTDSGNYRGTIIDHTDHHILQKLNSGSTVAHPTHLLPQLPAIGDAVRIRYSHHRATVNPFQQRAKAQGLER